MLSYDTISAEHIEITEFVRTDELFTSCSHANNRYKMYLMHKDKKAQEPEQAQKIKALHEELNVAKKRKKELEVTAQKLAESADEKAKEAWKKTDVATMETLLIESNASKKAVSGDNEDRCSNKTKRRNIRSEKELKLPLSRNSCLDQLSITKMCSDC